ncbi:MULTISPECIES: hypothetical protein [unclassified Arcicella]|uniref:hypothetical protein n=1 Tax=unclassified Arcicella TaxID=2644986 RepID=UPI002855017C|nr:MULTISPECIES: hypothetical protein [unclassified Arcicella]MDR6563261.1 hypothetical protein [Arcicella sp. BE51]MDR6811588.1 hypothetical protein [Arcicella sp. BE140]MDR6823114.1 hypothetical protein [Arcicella sp. BE139]
MWKIDENYLLKDVQRDFLKYTAQQIKFDLMYNYPVVLPHFEVNLKDRQYQFWERNPLSVDLYSRKVVEQKLSYIHANPLNGKWSLANSPTEYWFSSYRFYEMNIDEFGLLTHYLEDC